MTTRLEHILSELARIHAPHLPAAAARQPDPARFMAQELAGAGVLVMVGEVPEHLLAGREQLVENWMLAYGDLYLLLVKALFPSYTRFAPYYADGHLPAIVVIEGESSPVMRALAGYVAPYIHLRQDESRASVPEVRGLMALVLDELEANDLPQGRYQTLIRGGMESIFRLLELPVRQVALTAFEQEILRPLPQHKAPSRKTAPPERPATLPPDAPADPQAGPLQQSRIPIFFRPGGSTGEGGKRRPPVPKLPPRKGRGGG